MGEIQFVGLLAECRAIHSRFTSIQSRLKVETLTECLMDCATVEHYLGGGIAKHNFCSCSPVLELTRWLNTNMP